MVEDIQGKVDSLSKVKKLPASITKEGLEEAKAGLASLREEWGKVQQIFTSGNLVEAVNAATSLRDKTVKIMEALGLSAPATAPAAAPAPATVPAPVPPAAK
jgi:hypothetical protein